MTWYVPSSNGMEKCITRESRYFEYGTTNLPTFLPLQLFRGYPGRIFEISNFLKITSRLFGPSRKQVCLFYDGHYLSCIGSRKMTQQENRWCGTGKINPMQILTWVHAHQHLNLLSWWTDSLSIVCRTTTSIYQQACYENSCAWEFCNVGVDISHLTITDC